jgi:integration host factor subunit beta
MIRSELIAKIATENPHLTTDQACAVVSVFFETVIDHLSQGDRVEFRGFGAFRVKTREPRLGRNPRNGDPVAVERKRAVAFKASQTLLTRINETG